MGSVDRSNKKGVWSGGRVNCLNNIFLITISAVVHARWIGFDIW